MSNSTYLVGAEDVQRAGSSMRHAAEQMQSAANVITNAMEDQRRFLQNWLMDFADVMAQARVVPPAIAPEQEK